MVQYYPAWYPDFHCTAAACTDSCCIGWEIDLDPDAVRRYRALAGDMGRQIRSAVDWQADPPCFRLTEEGRCPFLEPSGLCRLILELGEGALCRICHRHPRFYHWLPGRTEVGLGLCCEEAGRLLLESPLPDRFCEEPALPGLPQEEACCTPAAAAALLCLRQAAFHLAALDDISVGRRCALLVQFGAGAQQLWEADAADDIGAFCDRWRDPAFLQTQLLALPAPDPAQAAADRGALLRQLAAFEPLDPAWPGRLLAADTALPAPGEPTGLTHRDCQHLLTYFLYRHLTEAAADGDVLGRVQLSCAGVLVLRLLAARAEREKGGALSVLARAALCKDFSKEVEYAPETVDRLLDAFYTQDWGSVPRFCAMLLS